MSTIHCPYCDHYQTLQFDHNFGYVEDRKHQQLCHECGKKFVFTSKMTITHTAHRADCLNGDLHDMQPAPNKRSCWPDWQQCTRCGEDLRGRYVEQPLVAD